MLRLGSRFLSGLFSLLFLTTCIYSQAQAAGICTRVVSMVRDVGGSFLLLNTTGDTALPPPTVRYFAQDGGQLVMVADFPGLIWNLPPQVVIPLNSPLTQIRVGQFQANPPICRISIKSRTESALNDVAFRSAPGTLMVTWLGHNHLSLSLSQNLNNTSTKFPHLPDNSALRQKSFPANQQDLNNNYTNSATESQSLQSPTLRVDGTNPVRISLISPQPFNYRSFRLHEPERYVIDFNSGTASSSFNVPIIKTGSAIKDIRLGSPLDEPNKLRMVLDLVSTSTDVEETSGPNRLLLSVQGPCNFDAASGTDQYSQLQSMRNSDAYSQSLRSREEYSQSLRELDSFKRANILKGVSIVLDAGHGGSDPGAQRGSIQEKDITLGIVEKLYRKLTVDGARVSLTRSDDIFISLQDRVRLSLDAHPDIFLSVHINSLESNNAMRGIETYYRTDQSFPLAQCIHTALVNQLETPDRGIRNARFFVINHTPIPSVLAEVGFISNPEERLDLASGEYQYKVARALEDGIALYAQQTNISHRSIAPERTLATGSTSQDEAVRNYDYSRSGRTTLPQQTVEQASTSSDIAPASGRIHSVPGNPVMLPHI